MRAGLITGQRQFELIDVPEPAPTATGVVVEIKLCGICGSDVHAYTDGWDYAPGLCGHEWFGEVVAVGGDVSSVSEGAFVMGGMATGCGACAYCTAGHPQYCRPAARAYNGMTEDRSPSGGFAPFHGVDASRLALMPEGITASQGALVEPSSVAFHAVRQSRQRPGDVVVVVGAGPIGQLTAQCAKLAGAGMLIVVEPNERRRALAAELGADVVLEGGDGTRAQIRELTNGLGADLAYDAAGVPQTLEASINLVRRGGSVCLVGVSSAPTEVRTNRWMSKEISITTSFVFTLAEASRVAQLIVDGRLQADRLHEDTIELDALPAMIEAMASREVDSLKVLVDPTAG